MRENERNVRSSRNPRKQIGGVTHNFYLYNNPETGQLVWIPWDHNMTFGVGMGGGRGNVGGPGGMDGRGNVSFDKADINENWPLIRFLLDDPVYNAKYLAEASALFDAGQVSAHIEEMAEMLLPYIVAAGEEDQFNTALEELIASVSQQDAAVADFLATQP